MGNDVAHGLAGTAGASKAIALRVRDPADGNAGAYLQAEIVGTISASIDESLLATSAKQDTAQTTLTAAAASLVSILARLTAGTHSGGSNVGATSFGTYKSIATAACKIRSAKATNKGGADGWLMLFDQAGATPPVNGTAPSRAPIPVATMEANGDEWGTPGTTFAAGCLAALSSTPVTLTIIVASDAYFDVEVAP